MIEATRAIFLHHVKYSETSVIATLYTEAFGRQSYIINGIRSPKSKQKSGLLQPLFMLEIEAYHKAGREVQRLKELRIESPFQTIPFTIAKSTIAIFLAEILYKTIPGEEPDPSLFQFVYQSVISFDTMEKGVANFHLWFLANYLLFLGFKPENNFSPSNQWFDLKNGRFLVSKPLHPVTPTPEDSALLSKLFRLDLDQLHTFPVNSTQRKRLLDLLVEYYAIHSESFGRINSLQVLKEIFQ